MLTTQPSSNRLARLALAAGLGLWIGLALAARFLNQPETGSAWQRFLLPALFAAGAALAAYVSLFRYVWPRLRDRSLAIRVAWTTIAILAGAWLVVAIPIPLPQQLRMHYLEVIALGERNPAAKGTEVWLGTIYRADGSEVPRDELAFEGDWEVREGVPVSFQHQPATARWSGLLHASARMEFVGHPWSGHVRVVWDGQAQTIDLYAPESTRRVVPLPVVPQSPSVGYRALLHGGDTLGLALLVLVGSVALATRPLRTPRSQPRARWWTYAGLCAAVWTVTLCALWPGLMSPDSVEQWRQMVDGDYEGTHPVFHTLTMWLITRAWLSPAAVALAQILALSVVTGTLLARLRGLGLSAGLSWLLCVLFAFSPVNNALVITLWKDVAFTITVLILTRLLLEIVVSQGRWLARPRSAVLLALTCVAMALYRHNGLPEAVVVLVALLLACRRYWRPLALTTIVVVAVSVGTQRLIDRALNVQPSAIPGWLGPVLHHLTAQMQHRPELTVDEQQLLDAARPTGEWPYDPYCANTVMYDRRADMRGMRAHRFELARLCLKLDLRHPAVAWEHITLSSSFVWRLTHPHDSWLSLALGVLDNNGLQSIAVNRFGLATKPILPALTHPLAACITTSQRESCLWLTWRPALYLYALLAGVLIAAARTRDPRYLLVAAPVLINAALIAFLAPAQDFRYQYPTYAVSLLLSIFLLWAAPRPEAAPAVSAGGFTSTN